MARGATDRALYEVRTDRTHGRYAPGKIWVVDATLQAGIVELDGFMTGVDMAVTDQTTVRELVRAVMGALQDEPVVRRFWYLAFPSRYDPEGAQRVFFYVPLHTDDEGVRTRIVRVLSKPRSPIRTRLGW